MLSFDGFCYDCSSGEIQLLLREKVVHCKKIAFYCCNLEVYVVCREIISFESSVQHLEWLFR